MKSEFKDFIGIFENAIPEDICNKFIDDFEGWKKTGLTFNRQDSEGAPKHQKDDDAFVLADSYKKNEATDSFVVPENHITRYGNYAGLFSQCWDFYITKYSMVGNMSLQIYYSKIQKTIPGGGYHIWHYERDCRSMGNRAFAFTVYLNDVEEGGETEFLYQKMRVKPTKGTLVVWPADWTHTHRGNPPFSGVKYIYTGWIEYAT